MSKNSKERSRYEDAQARRVRIEDARQLGQYTRGKKIGEGGIGTVFLAEHSLLRRPTALKPLARERAGNKALAHFEREVRITNLTHPNTVAIYDYPTTP